MVPMTDASSSRLSNLVARPNAGDPAARDELIGHACEGLRRLTHRMLQSYGRVRRREDTGDVLHNAVVRLLQALREVPPTSVQHFFHLATLQIRRELIN